MKITPLFDQSVFVSGAIADVLREAASPPGLTADDPAVPGVVAFDPDRAGFDPAFDPVLPRGLDALGETMNIMTLGGLALAVGILVDDATVGDREHLSPDGGAAAVRRRSRRVRPESRRRR